MATENVELSAEQKKEFGQYIQMIRKKNRMSQVAAAEKLGISSGYFSHIETGRVAASEKLIRKAATAFHLDYFDLLKRAGIPIDEVEDGESTANDTQIPTQKISNSEAPADILEWAWNSLRSDPTFNFAAKFGSTDFPRSSWLGFVEMYQATSGRILLKNEEIEELRNSG